VIYLLTPLALALLFDNIGSLAEFGRAYFGSLVVVAAIGGSFELTYRFVWPALIRTKPPWWLRIAGHALTIAVAVGGGAAIADVVGRGALGWQLGRLPRLWLQAAVISTVIISILVVTDELAARARDLERREAALKVAALRAELNALQARTDPHFLFNSLNTVAALIPDDPALAESLLERLAAVFRYALDAGRRDSVALADEIEAVTSYLEVEALRLGARLRWRLDREPGLDDVRVPPLVLQPLVENAIRHGAGGRVGETELEVSARRRDGELVLVVEDRGSDGAAAKPTPPGAGTALADLRARLAIAYPERGRLEAAATPAGWRAEVVLPL
jgi:LytS/YehU family sensor histidine kinase